MKPPYSKVAIIHDVFVEFGGAERVLLELLTLYPHADIYIPLLSDDKKKLLKRYSSGRIFTSSLNSIPFVHSASILLKPILFWYWQALDLAEYELVISSSHSFSSKAVITGALTKHVSYIHTPPRYLYVEYNETRILRSKFMRGLLSPLTTWLRSQDYLAAQRPDVLVANSRTVQRRIQKYYRRDSKIIYPPIHIPAPKRLITTKKTWDTMVGTLSTTSKNKQLRQILVQGKYFVCFSRLAKQKGIDLAVRTCTKLHLPLVVVGQGSELEHLRSLAGQSILFVGAVSDDTKTILLSQAAALLYCSIEEDFGMVTAEALAHGTPVIGYNSGGTAEIVTRKTGVLFNEFTVENLELAIKKYNASTFAKTACRSRAMQFSANRFRTTFARLVTKAL